MIFLSSLCAFLSCFISPVILPSFYTLFHVGKDSAFLSLWTFSVNFLHQTNLLRSSLLWIIFLIGWSIHRYTVLQWNIPVFLKVFHLGSEFSWAFDSLAFHHMLNCEYISKIGLLHSSCLHKEPPSALTRGAHSADMFSSLNSLRVLQVLFPGKFPTQPLQRAVNSVVLLAPFLGFFWFCLWFTLWKYL